jgi:hypothetical protein
LIFEWTLYSTSFYRVFDKKSKREINYIISEKEKEKRIIAKFDKQEKKGKKVKKNKKR